MIKNILQFKRKYDTIKGSRKSEKANSYSTKRETNLSRVLEVGKGAKVLGRQNFFLKESRFQIKILAAKNPYHFLILVEVKNIAAKTYLIALFLLQAFFPIVFPLGRFRRDFSIFYENSNFFRRKFFTISNI